eukprot:4227649-Amphidinium_carterae.2
MGMKRVSVLSKQTLDEVAALMRRPKVHPESLANVATLAKRPRVHRAESLAEVATLAKRPKVQRESTSTLDMSFGRQRGDPAHIYTNSTDIRASLAERAANEKTRRLDCMSHRRGRVPPWRHSQ